MESETRKCVATLNIFGHPLNVACPGEGMHDVATGRANHWCNFDHDSRIRCGHHDPVYLSAPSPVAEKVSDEQLAIEILRQIVYAGDACRGHRECLHDMKPWQLARALLTKMDEPPLPVESSAPQPPEPATSPDPEPIACPKCGATRNYFGLPFLGVPDVCHESPCWHPPSGPRSGDGGRFCTHHTKPSDKPVSEPSPEPSVKVGRTERVYVAARASVPERAAMWRALREKGHPIISSWIDEAGPGETASMHDLWLRVIREVQSASLLVFYVEPDDFPLKGALVEVGAALAAGVPVRVVAPGVTIGADYRPIGSWLAHPLVTVNATIESALPSPSPARTVPEGERETRCKCGKVATNRWYSVERPPTWTCDDCCPPEQSPSVPVAPEPTRERLHRLLDELLDELPSDDGEEWGALDEAWEKYRDEVLEAKVSVSGDAAAPQPSATPSPVAYWRCRTCKALWREFGDGTFSLQFGETCGKCCDNEPINETTCERVAAPGATSYNSTYLKQYPIAGPARVMAAKTGVGAPVFVSSEPPSPAAPPVPSSPAPEPTWQAEHREDAAGYLTATVNIMPSPAPTGEPTCGGCAQGLTVDVGVHYGEGEWNGVPCRVASSPAPSVQGGLTGERALELANICVNSGTVGLRLLDELTLYLRAYATQLATIRQLERTPQVECPYCGVAKPISEFDDSFDGCSVCAQERAECAYHVKLHPDEKCTCPRKKTAPMSDDALYLKGWYKLDQCAYCRAELWSGPIGAERDVAISTHVTSCEQNPLIRTIRQLKRASHGACERHAESIEDVSRVVAQNDIEDDPCVPCGYVRALRALSELTAKNEAAEKGGEALFHENQQLRATIRQHEETIATDQAKIRELVAYDLAHLHDLADRDRTIAELEQTITELTSRSGPTVVFVSGGGNAPPDKYAASIHCWDAHHASCAGGKCQCVCHDLRAKLTAAEETIRWAVAECNAVAAYDHAHVLQNRLLPPLRKAIEESQS